MKMAAEEIGIAWTTVKSVAKDRNKSKQLWKTQDRAKLQILGHRKI